MSPASHFFSVQKQKSVLAKNPFANVVKKHISLIFSPARKIHRLFSDSQIF
jgi:hypothetical protein